MQLGTMTYLLPSFQRYCDRHHVFKTTEEIQQLTANRTAEQARADELEEQQEQAENAEIDARNARYLKEKCPACAEKCKWYFEQTGQKKE
jgi:hypothetical protein